MISCPANSGEGILRKGRIPSCALAWFFVAIIVRSPLPAQLSTSIQLTAQANFASDNQKSLNHSGVGSFSIYTSSGPDVTAAAVGIIEDGSIGASASGEAEVDYAFPGAVGFASAMAAVSYKDKLTWYSPSLALGTPVKIIVNFGLFGKSFLDSYSIADDASGYVTDDASFNTQVFIGLSNKNSYESLTGNGQTQDGSPLSLVNLQSGDYNDVVNLNNGQSYTLEMQLDLSGSALAGGFPPEEVSGNALGYFSDVFNSTLAWGGIIAAYGPNGEPIPFPVITSASGIDYNRSYIPPADQPNSVPDGVDTIVIAAVGFVVLAGWRKVFPTV
jgi:hypothetical protein